jgi:hypothetical protein
VSKIDVVIDHALKDVLRRLTQLTVAEPAYAVGLAASPGNDSFAVQSVAVALERDRAKWHGRTDLSEADLSEAVFESWNPYEFSIRERWGTRPKVDEAFEACEAEVRADLMARGIEDQQRYIYNRVAAKIDPACLKFAVTDDFIAFVFLGPDFMETVENIRFSASPEALAVLEYKDLLE